MEPASSSVPPPPNDLLNRTLEAILEKLTKIDMAVSTPPQPNRPQDVRAFPPEEHRPYNATMSTMGTDDEGEAAYERRRHPHHGRIPLRRADHDTNRDIKVKIPTFAGRVDPEAYLDWERRLDYIFDCYGYSEHKKVAVAAAQLTDFALSWWDRESSDRRRLNIGLVTTWAEMKNLLKRRFVPPHFHRDIQKKFRSLRQGLRSVEEYFEEFENLRNRLGLEDSEEALMAQFVDGLNEKIARKVERQTYYEFQDLLHLAIKIEQQNKRKAQSSFRTYKQPSWSQPATTSQDKAKTMDKGKAPAFNAPKPSRAEPKIAPIPAKTRDIVCFKCQGRGHFARECPNQRVMVITAAGEYESQDEHLEEDSEDQIEDYDYPEVGDMLVMHPWKLKDDKGEDFLS